jgi:hypothetical protein
VPQVDAIWMFKSKSKFWAACCVPSTRFVPPFLLTGHRGYTESSAIRTLPPLLCRRLLLRSLLTPGPACLACQVWETTQ